MENPLRLAERQGLLQGHLSPVQQEGLRLLIYADNRQRIKDEDEAMKLALLASGQRTPQELWPERFDGVPAPRRHPTEPGTIVVDETVENFMAEIPDGADYSAVRWLTPADGESFEEALRLAELLDQTAVTVSEPADPRVGEWQ